MSAELSRQPLSEQLPLILESQCPPFPPHSSKLQAQCLELLLKGSRLTHPEFQAKTGSWRLSAVIHELAGLGWPIKRDDMQHNTCSHRQIRIRVYWLDITAMNSNHVAA